MRNSIFFVLEKLEITTSERTTMIVLSSVLLITALFHQMELTDTYDASYYAEYDAKFEQLAYEADQRDKKIAAQYYPEEQIGNGTNEIDGSLAKDTQADSEETASIADTSNANEDTVNVNTADTDQLESLPGIGPSIARNLIEYREENGPFKKFSDLLHVRGIGEARLENIRPYISLE